MYSSHARTAMDAIDDLGACDYHQPHPVRTLAELRPVMGKVEAWMRFFGYPSRDIFGLRLAVTEAVANAIRHGHRGDPDKQVTVTFRVLPDDVVVRVEDQGPGFDPKAVPGPVFNGRLDPHRGFGLFLMRVYTSWLHYNPRGNVVTLGRCRSQP